MPTSCKMAQIFAGHQPKTKRRITFKNQPDSSPPPPPALATYQSAISARGPKSRDIKRAKRTQHTTNKRQQRSIPERKRKQVRTQNPHQHIIAHGVHRHPREHDLEHVFEAGGDAVRGLDPLNAARFNPELVLPDFDALEEAAQRGGGLHRGLDRGWVFFRVGRHGEEAPAGLQWGVLWTAAAGVVGGRRMAVVAEKVLWTSVLT